MTAAACTALAVIVAGVALRPRPQARRPGARTSRAPLAHRLRRTSASRPPDVADLDAAAVAAWCESLARAVRSGSTLVAALRSVEPPPAAVSEMAPVLLRLERGNRLGDALDTTSPSPHLNVALTVLRACAVHGGPAAEPLDRAAATLRGRAADAAERRTQSAQARLSAVVMTVLPIAMLALLLATSSATRAAVAGPAGFALVVVGGALNLAGWRWMRRIIRRSAA